MVFLFPNDPINAILTNHPSNYPNPWNLQQLLRVNSCTPCFPGPLSLPTKPDVTWERLSKRFLRQNFWSMIQHWISVLKKNPTEITNCPVSTIQSVLLKEVTRNTCWICVHGQLPSFSIKLCQMWWIHKAASDSAKISTKVLSHQKLLNGSWLSPFIWEPRATQRIDDVPSEWIYYPRSFPCC